MVARRKLGIFVGEAQNWQFFRPIADSLGQDHELRVFREAELNPPIFRERLNRLMTARRMRSILRECDVAFFEWASRLLAQATRLPKSCPIVARLHSFELAVWSDKIRWSQVDRIIFVSRNIEQKFLAKHPDCRGRTVVVNNGVPVRDFAQVQRSDFGFNLGMMANFNPIKRIYEVVLMVHKLKQMGHRPHLHLAGKRSEYGYSGTYGIAVARAVQKLGLNDDVTFAGYVTDKPAWLSGIDIFLSNSYWEGQSVALLEALAAGCCCLAHFYDGADEVLPDDHIFMTDDEAIAKILRYAHAAPTEQEQIQAAMRSIAAANFDQADQCEGIKSVIASLS